MFRPIDEGLGFHKKNSTEKNVEKNIPLEQERFVFQPEEMLLVPKKSLLGYKLLSYVLDLGIVSSLSLGVYSLYELEIFYLLYFFSVTFFAYFICFWQNQTIGESLTGLKIQEKSFSKLCLRAFLLFIAPLTLGLFFLADEEKVSGTKVIEV